VPGFARLGAAALALGLAYSISAPFLSLFALDEAHLQPRELGLYMALSAVTGVLATTWLGKLSDRGLGRRRAMVLCLLCAALGHAAMSQLRGFGWLLLNTAILLAPGRASFSQTFSLARARFEGERVRDLTLATSTMRMFFSVAWVVGPALGALLVGRLHYSGLFLVSAAAYGAIVLLVLPLDPPAPDPDQPQPRTAVLAYLRQGPTAALTVGFGLLFLCANLNTMVLPLYVVETLHGSQREIGWVFGLTAGLEIPLMVWTALIAARLGKGRMIVVGALLYGVYFLAMAAAQRPWQLYPAMGLNAVVVSIVMGLGMSYFQDLLPGEPGVSTALYASAMNVGSVLAGPAFAALAGPHGHRELLMACAASCLVGGALLAYGARRLHDRATRVPE
jgi:SET family sugar efflux transporter-like MFS transporter